MDLDYSNCLINPASKLSIKELKEKYKEFDGVLPMAVSKGNRYMFYIVLMYDLNSPIKGMFTNLFEQKVKSAMMAGYEIDKEGKFEEKVENMLIGENKEINRMIVRYIIMHGLPDLIQYTASSEIISIELERSLNSRDRDSKELTAISLNIDKETKKLNELYIKIFGKGEAKKLRNQLYETIEEDRLKMRPEHMAMRIAQKKLDILDVYETGVEYAN